MYSSSDRCDEVYRMFISVFEIQWNFIKIDTLDENFTGTLISLASHCT